MPYFYRLPVNTPIASSHAYRSGQIFGIDVSSGAVVMALDPGIFGRRMHAQRFLYVCVWTLSSILFT